MIRSCNHLDNKLFNVYIITGVLLRPWKCIVNFFRGSVENPLGGEMPFEKMVGKRREWRGLYRILVWSRRLVDKPLGVKGL
jgi:hypothetical protein